MGTSHNNSSTDTNALMERLQHVNSVLRAIRNVNQLITKETSRDALLKGICDCLTETRGYFSAWVALLNDDLMAAVETASSGFGSEFERHRAQLECGHLPHCVREALVRHDAHVVLDTKRDCPDCPLWHADSDRAGLVHRLEFGGRVYGVLAVSVPVRFADDAEELDLFSEVAGDLAFALRRLEDAERLARNENLVRETGRIARIGGWEHDLRSGEARWSDVLYDILEFERAGPIPGPEEHLEYYGPEDRARLTAAYQAAVETGEPFDLELQCRTAKGREFWARVIGQAVFEGGECVRMIGTFQDITLRKEVEIARDEQRKLMGYVIRYDPNAIAVYDNDLRYIYVSDRYLQDYNVQMRDVIGKHHYEVFPEMPQRWKDIHQRVLAGAVERSEDDFFVRPDGSKTYNRWECRPWYHADGSIGGMITYTEVTTDRKLAEEGLRRKQVMLERTEQAANVGSWEWDIATDTVTWSKELYRLFGLDASKPPPNYAGQELLYVPEDAKRLREAVERAASQGRPYELEMMAVRADGALRNAIVTGYPERGPDGQVVRLYGSFQDVTERKEAEETYSRFIQLTHEMICVADLDTTTFLQVNPAFERVLGYSREELLGQSFLNFLHPEDVDATVGVIEEKLKQGADVIEFENRYRCKDGSYRHIQWNSYPVPCEGRTYAMAQDITDRKQAERRLRESEHRFRSFVENASDIVYSLTPEGVFTYMSPNWQELMGEPAEAAVGRSFEPYVHPEDRHLCHEFLERVLRTGERLDSVEYRAIRPDGSITWHASRGSPLRDEAGNVVSYVGVARDITEQRKLEEQLRQSQKMEAVGRLAGGVAHDFNNVLTAILGNAELAQIGLETGELKVDTLRGELRQIENAAQQAARLTRQLLAFSRRQITQPQVLDLNHTIGGLEKMLRRLLAEDIVFKFVPAMSLSPVRMDPAQVEQVVMNLVVNAGDAMPRGGRLTIETSDVVLDQDYARVHVGANPGRYVLIAVSDNGCGMDEETRRQIWEPFFTTKGVGRGTGLGLATVYGIVKQAGGYVMVYSELGHGSTFKVYLPAYAGEEQAVSIAFGEAPRRLSGTESVLVCEDDEAVRGLTTQMLQSAGYRVLTARHGREAIALAEQAEPAIAMLITDVVMPDMNGRELVDALAQRGMSPPVLFVSGYTSNVIAHHGVLDKDVEFLEKPFSRDTLLRRVRNVLDELR